MCPVSTTEVLEDIIIEKVNQGHLFTAFDITLEGKKRGMTDRHRDVKRITHEFFESQQMGQGYKRTMLDVGAPEKAFVYHPLNADPDTYGKPALRRKSPHHTTPRQSPANAPGTPQTTSPALSLTSLPKSPDEANADARGSVCVPAKILRQAGLRPLDKVVVDADAANNTITMLLDEPGIVGPAPNNTRRPYVVNRDCNLRITNLLFRLAGIPRPQRGDKYKVNVTAGSIVVRA